MYIAVTAEGDNLSSLVSAGFAACRFLLIVSMDDLQVRAIENKGNMTEKALAEAVVKADCEAVITGILNAEAFEIIAAACVTRYAAPGMAAAEALDLMEKYRLPHIKDPAGAEPGHHHHGHGTCGSCAE